MLTVTCGLVEIRDGEDQAERSETPRGGIRAESRREPRAGLKTSRSTNRARAKVGGGRGIRTPGTVSGSVVFKTVQGWEGHRPLPICTNKTGPIIHMSLVLIGASPYQDRDKKRTIPLMSPPTPEPRHKATVGRPSFQRIAMSPAADHYPFRAGTLTEGLRQPIVLWAFCKPGTIQHRPQPLGNGCTEHRKLPQSRAPRAFATVRRSRFFVRARVRHD